MKRTSEKEIIIKKFDVRYGVEKAEEEANKIVSEGYELFSVATGGAEDGQLNKLILVFKKKYR